MEKSLDRTHYQVTFAVLAAGVGAYALLQSLVSPVLPAIQESLHTSQNTVTWVLTAYLLSASVFTPILGRIGDAVGKERMFVVALGALAVGSLLAALAPNIQVMILARAIQGIGGGALPLSFGIIRDEFPKDKVAGAVGILAALVAVGAGLGIVLAGPIVNALDYHWLFWIPMFIVTAAAIAAHVFVPESPVRTPGKISWAAALLLSAWLVALLVGFSKGSSWGWTSPSIIGMFTLAAALAAVWIAVEVRSDSPLVDMKMMRIPTVWTTNVVALLLGVVMYAVFAFVPEFLQTAKSSGYGFGASITQAGLLLLPMTIAMFIIGLASGKLAKRFGSKKVLLAGSIVSIIPFAILAFAHTHTWEIFLAMLSLGIGFGLAFAAMSNLIVSAVRADQTGVASGMNANIRTIGGSIGAAVMASIVTSSASADGIPKESGYTNGYIFLGLAAVAAAVAAVFIPRVKVTADTDVVDMTDELRHPELALVAAGTLSGADSE